MVNPQKLTVFPTVCSPDGKFHRIPSNHHFRTVFLWFYYGWWTPFTARFVGSDSKPPCIGDQNQTYVAVYRWITQEQLLLGGSSHLVRRLYPKLFQWINLAFSTYKWGFVTYWWSTRYCCPFSSQEQLLRVLGLALVKWTLIGRYREGDHDTRRRRNRRGPGEIHPKPMGKGENYRKTIET